MKKTTSYLSTSLNRCAIACWALAFFKCRMPILSITVSAQAVVAGKARSGGKGFGEFYGSANICKSCWCQCGRLHPLADGDWNNTSAPGA